VIATANTCFLSSRLCCLCPWHLFAFEVVSLAI
jgi:hypothetical protein